MWSDTSGPELFLVGDPGFDGIDDIAERFSGESSSAWNDIMSLLGSARAVLAAYNYEDYHGAAEVVVVRRDGTILAWSGSHCSCDGLSDSWDGPDTPARVNVEYLRRLNMGPEFGRARDKLVAWCERNGID